MNLKIAIISDIHSNIFALEKVLTDIHKRNIDLTVNLGDSLYGPIDPTSCADILMNSDIVSIMGNEDAILLNQDADQEVHSSHQFTCQNLKAKHFDWIRSLNFSESIHDLIFICHGTPESYCNYLLEDIDNGFPVLKSNQEIENITGKIRQKVIFCGHSHLNNVFFTGSKTIINPGSVGLQAYEDFHPTSHIMQSGNPYARYSIVHIKEDIIGIENIAIKYKWDLAAKEAKKNGKANWSKWLKTGRVK